MKTKSTIVWLGACALAMVLASSAVAAARPRATGFMSGRAFTLGARTLEPSKATPELPYADGDYAYSAGFRLYEGVASWQLAVDYAPEPGEEELFDYAVTPQLNLYMGYKWLSGGLGLRNTYLSGEEEDDWVGFYYEAHLGLELPLGSRAALGVYASWSFEDLSVLDEFEFDELEYVGMLSIRF